MKIALAQINTKVGDLKGNVNKIIEKIQEAKSKNAQLVVFPELSIVGYPPRDLLDFRAFIEDNIKELDRIKEHTDDIGVIVGFVDFNSFYKGLNYYNSAAFIYKGEVIQKYYKRLLPYYDVFDETRYFEPGKTSNVTEFMGKKVGITICEDIWNDKSAIERSGYRCNPILSLVDRNADVIINLSASPFHLNKEKFRFTEISGMAKKYHVPIVYVNQTGGNDDLLFDGMSFAVDNQGKIQARCTDFEEDMVIYDLDANSGELKNYSECEEASLFKALSMGLKDYCAKMGFKKVILGLSGGIDSALTAVIACDALGSENVLGITMPSMYSSEGSVSDSQILAKNLNMECLEIPIKPIFNCFIDNMQKEDLKMDLAEENLQARIRGNILMTYSNRYGYMLLSTGNKSEMSVGYCTLYGDMAGGLNLLSDVPKTMVYKISKYINREKEIIPNDVIIKPPSAELRPDQKDQDSLPPYEILDEILKEYVEENKTPDEISQKYPKEVVYDIVKKINKNEYKRNQATLGLKVTTRAFGSGRRFPIVQGYDFRMH